MITPGFMRAMDDGPTRSKRPPYPHGDASDAEKALYHEQMEEYWRYERKRLDAKAELMRQDSLSVLTCPLRPTETQGRVPQGGLRRQKDCAWCAGPLPPRRREWCSDACWQAYYGNHRWSVASARAALRDGYRCVRCGSRAGAHRLHYNHDRAQDRVEASCWDFECPKAHYQISQGRLEVDHIEPRWGRGYGDGCHNHQSNLQTLCHGCHVTAGVVRRRFILMWEIVQRPLLGPGLTSTEQMWLKWEGEYFA